MLQTSKKEQAWLIKGSRCFNCKEKGYITYNCPKKGKIAAMSKGISKNSNS